MQVTRAADVSSTNTSTTSSTTQTKTLGQQDFLNLLVTQLTNQDPTSPMDDKDFLTQMAQFSTVQGVTDMSGKLADAQATSLLGKTVSGTHTSDGKSTSVNGTVDSVTLSTSGITLNVGNDQLTPDEVTLVK